PEPKIRPLVRQFVPHRRQAARAVRRRNVTRRRFAVGGCGQLPSLGIARQSIPQAILAGNRPLGVAHQNVDQHPLADGGRPQLALGAFGVIALKLVIVGQIAFPALRVGTPPDDGLLGRLVRVGDAAGYDDAHACVSWYCIRRAPPNVTLRIKPTFSPRPSKMAESTTLTVPMPSYTKRWIKPCGEAVIRSLAAFIRS